MAKSTKSSKPSRSSLIKSADKKFSLYIRQVNADENGFVKCFTCPHRNHWKKLQCGHWVVRQYKYTRWEVDNARPQCYACNMLFNGRPHIFRENLVNEIGEERVKRIEEISKKLFTESDDWIKQVIEAIPEVIPSLGLEN